MQIAPKYRPVVYTTLFLIAGSIIWLTIYNNSLRNSSGIRYLSDGTVSKRPASLSSDSAARLPAKESASLVFGIEPEVISGFLPPAYPGYPPTGTFNDATAWGIRVRVKDEPADIFAEYLEYFKATGATVSILEEGGSSGWRCQILASTGTYSLYVTQDLESGRGSIVNLDRQR